VAAMRKKAAPSISIGMWGFCVFRGGPVRRGVSKDLSFYFKIGDADQLIPKRDLTPESSSASMRTMSPSMARMSASISSRGRGGMYLSLTALGISYDSRPQPLRVRLKKERGL